MTMFFQGPFKNYFSIFGCCTYELNTPGVSVIIGAHSHTLLGRGSLKAFGLNPDGPYPTKIKSAQGKTVCVVEAWCNSMAIGDFYVTFNKKNNVISCSGHPVILLGNIFKQEKNNGDNVVLKNNDLNEVLKIIKKTPEFSIVTKNVVVEKIIDQYKKQIDSLEYNIIGYSAKDFVPYNNLKPFVKGQKPEKTNYSSPLVAVGILDYFKDVDFALINSGGVRSCIKKGSISGRDIYMLLPFNSELLKVKITGREIKQMLEDSVVVFGNMFPVMAGLYFGIDYSANYGNRVGDILYKDKKTGKLIPLDINHEYLIAVDAYIVNSSNSGGLYNVFYNIKKNTPQNVYSTGVHIADSFIHYIKNMPNKIIDFNSDDFYITYFKQ